MTDPGDPQTEACPDCEGRGQTNAGIICRKCEGMGRFVPEQPKIWKNIPTEIVAHWIEITETLSTEAYRLARDTFDEALEMREGFETPHPVTHLGQVFAVWWDEMNPLTRHLTAYPGLLAWALNQVDWFELAEHYIDTLDEFGPSRADLARCESCGREGAVHQSWCDRAEEPDADGIIYSHDQDCTEQQ